MLSIRKIKGLSSWATAEVQRMGGEGIQAQQHSRLMSILVRCMRFSFTGAPALTQEDRDYAENPGKGASNLSSLQTFTMLCPLVLGKLLGNVYAGYWSNKHGRVTAFASWFLSGGIDVDLALQVVTALDDVCNISSRSFELPSLTAVLREVCLWLVEQRIGPQAIHETYRACDPYGQVRTTTGRLNFCYDEGGFKWCEDSLC